MPARAGYRTGLYTKPHLVNLAERTRISGAEIPAARMLDYIERLRAIYDRAGMALTFFEFTVAMMFLYFADEHVDIAIVETGLGGRLDSTNVVTPILSVITPIGFDHMEYLGYTIAAIAGEKGGIIKHDVPVVIGARDAEARLVLTSIAAQRHSAVRLIDRDFSYKSHAPAHRLDYHGLGLDLPDLETSLAGPFQHENAAIARRDSRSSAGARLAHRRGRHPPRHSRNLLAGTFRRRVEAPARHPRLRA